MVFLLSFLVDGVFLLYNCLRDANAFPFGATVMHSVHHLTMAADIFGVGVRAVPVGESGLLSDLGFAFDELAVSKDVGSCIIYPFFLSFSILDSWRPKCDVTM